MAPAISPPMPMPDLAQSRIRAIPDALDAVFLPNGSRPLEALFSNCLARPGGNNFQKSPESKPKCPAFEVVSPAFLLEAKHRILTESRALSPRDDPQDRHERQAFHSHSTGVPHKHRSNHSKPRQKPPSPLFSSTSLASSSASVAGSDFQMFSFHAERIYD